MWPSIPQTTTTTAKQTDSDAMATTRWRGQATLWRKTCRNIFFVFYFYTLCPENCLAWNMRWQNSWLGTQFLVDRVSRNSLKLHFLIIEIFSCGELMRQTFEAWRPCQKAFWQSLEVPERPPFFDRFRSPDGKRCETCWQKEWGYAKPDVCNETKKRTTF